MMIETLGITGIIPQWRRGEAPAAVAADRLVGAVLLG
jgi:hypothetical protein